MTPLNDLFILTASPAADVSVPIAFFAAIVLIVFLTSKFNYQTKKAILENGGNIEMVRKKFPFLEIGITIIGIGIGLAISVIPRSFELPQDLKGLLTGACILLFGGLGLISAFFIRRKIEKK